MVPEQIIDGARTVAHLAVYLDELRQTAQSLLGHGNAGQRGFFTPSEDEAVRQLLVSYCQARAALLDLATSFRDDTTLSEELRPAAFLVAYAAAALLVDAARFLRDSFHDRPVVRQKLNEPEPHFGIPAGTYDTVQQSLTSVRHAWHLYHAAKYFETHEGELRALAREGALRPCLAVIDRFRNRLMVPAVDYAQVRVRVRGSQAIGRLRNDLLGQAMYGMQKLMGNLASVVSVRPGHHPTLPETVAADLAARLQPGDVLVTRKEFAVTNYFLPGYWPHAALYLGDPATLVSMGLDVHENVRPRWQRLLEADRAEPRRVLEALKDGVWIRSLRSPFSSDALVVIRPRLSAANVAQALARGLFHEGKAYDFDFDFTRSDRLVCTEVVYRSYEGIGGVEFQLTRRAGRQTLAAEDLLNMACRRRHFEPVALFDPAQSDKLLGAFEADEVLKRRPQARDEG